MNQVRKLRSKYYTKILEVNVPVRFYWTDIYDGFEFGEFKEGLTKYQKSLLNELMYFMVYQMYSASFVDYMKEHYPVEFHKIIDEIESNDLGIPQAFLDAFKNDEER